MGAPMRVQGQDVVVQVVKGGQVVADLTDVKSADFQPKMEVKAEGFLGEATDRHDETYSGVNGKLVFHLHSAGIQKFLADIVARAKRASAQFTVNLTMTVRYPGTGETQRLLFPDIKVGNPQVSNPGRADYGTLTLDWAADDYKVIG